MPFIDLSASGWDLFFPDSCAITVPNGTTANDIGEVVTAPVALAGHGAVSCALVFKGGKVVTIGGVQAGVSTHEIHLRGHFPNVKALMICSVTRKGGINAGQFKVLSAGADSQGVKTILHVEQVS